MLVNVARLYPEKAQGLLLDCFAEIVRSRPQTKLWLMGVGPLESALKEHVAALGLEQQVIFLGFVVDLHRTLLSADIQVHSSYAEGVPLAICSGMAAGMPIVSTAVGGIPEILRHEETGLLVANGDGPAFVRETIRLIDDEELRRRLSRRAKEASETEFSLETAGAVLTAQYEKLVASMRVGILAGCLGRGDGGPETYERELIRAIARQDKVNEYRIYAFEPTAASCLGALPDNFRVRVLWPRNRWISLTTSLPVMMVRDSIDVLHGSLYPPPICPAPLVFTMHDVSPLTRPDFFAPEVYRRLNPLVRKGLNRARVVLCVSNDALVVDRLDNGDRHQSHAGDPARRQFHVQADRPRRRLAPRCRKNSAFRKNTSSMSARSWRGKT